MGFAKKYEKTNRLLLHNYLWGTYISIKQKTAAKQNSTLTRHFGTMYINFDDYIPYTGTIYEIFETNINAHIKWCHGYPYSTTKVTTATWINKEGWWLLKNYFHEANKLNICVRTKLCKTCKYIQDERKINEGFDLPPKN